MYFSLYFFNVCILDEPIEAVKFKLLKDDDKDTNETKTPVYLPGWILYDQQTVIKTTIGDFEEKEGKLR